MKMENLAELLSQLRENEKKINKEFEKIGISKAISIGTQFCISGKENIEKIAKETNSVLITDEWDYSDEYDLIYKTECYGFTFFDLHEKGME